MSAIAGSGRMRFQSGVSAVPIFGRVALNIAAGTFQGDGALAPAYWQLAEGTPSDGLLEAIGPSPKPSPWDFAAIRVEGDGDLIVSVALSPNGVWVGSAGDQVSMDFAVLKNGAPVYFETQLSPIFPGWVLGWSPGIDYTTTLPCVAGDVFAAAMRPSRQPAIYAYSAGDGSQTRFVVEGTLTGTGEEPSFAMRGSGSIGTAVA